MSELKKIFTNIYNKSIWNGKESKSGKGSDLENTKTVIEEIVSLVKDRDIKYITDCACGDFNWMKEVLKKLPEVHYLGYDIVEPLIENNDKLYGNDRTYFQCVDITSNPLPKSDLIICRDCLVHLSFDNIKKFIKNFVESESRYLLVTSFTGGFRVNKDYEEYERMWRTISFHREPFNYPEPLETISENCQQDNFKFHDKSLLLYSRKQLLNVVS